MSRDHRKAERYERALRLIASDLSDAAPEALQARLRRNIASAALCGYYVYKAGGGTVKYRIRSGPLRGTREVLYWPKEFSAQSHRERAERIHVRKDVRRMRRWAKDGRS
jgi:hypothetical protein